MRPEGVPYVGVTQVCMLAGEASGQNKKGSIYSLCIHKDLRKLPRE